MDDLIVEIHEKQEVERSERDQNIKREQKLFDELCFTESLYHKFIDLGNEEFVHVIRTGCDFPLKIVVAVTTTLKSLRTDYHTSVLHEFMSVL